jgi:hypothetical protein
MRCDDLQILERSAAVWPLVLDTDIREVHVTVDVREVVLASPLGNVTIYRLLVSLVPASLAIEVSQEMLVIAFQLVVENDPPHFIATVPKALAGVQIGPVEFRIVGQFSRLHDPGIERLLRFVSVTVAM